VGRHKECASWKEHSNGWLLKEDLLGIDSETVGTMKLDIF
jgi:hypothetical protein